MKHAALIVLAGLIAASPAIAQTAAGAAGGVADPASRPDRVCTEAQFQAALRGEYDGPPCRYAPEGAVAERQHARRAEALAGAPRRMTERPPITETRLQLSRPTPQHDAQPRRRTAGSTHASETVILDDGFFAGPQAGGVGREPLIVYGYRGVILIAPSGQTHLVHDQFRRSSRIVRAMDRSADHQVRRTRIQRR